MVYNYVLLLLSAIKCLTYLASRRFEASVFDCLFWGFNVRQQLKENVGPLDEFMKYSAIHGAGGNPVCVLYLVYSFHVLRLR